MNNMKYILLFLIAASSLRAGVYIKDETCVYVDMKKHGILHDSLVNYPQHAAEVKAAFADYVEAVALRNPFEAARLIVIAEKEKITIPDAVKSKIEAAQEKQAEEESKTKAEIESK